jgi:hypothetical protein
LFLERIEFVEEKEEEEETGNVKRRGIWGHWLIEKYVLQIALPPLPPLKRPLEQVKKDYKESYESLGQLCKVIRKKKDWIGFTMFI